MTEKIVSGVNKKNDGELEFSAKTGIELQSIADETIMPWGIKHKDIKKVEDKKTEETHRTACRRQRDRILYSGGFRRLQDKTQVLAATKNGDHRTRLTHTMEVEQISISLADAFGLNKDLAAAIALGHDVGHTPFGHAVERYLDNILKDAGCGGFSHALQSVRYFQEKGITLSDDIIEGIIKHDTDVYLGTFDNDQFDCKKYHPDKPGSLEAQVVYWADKIAYITHDLEDFITSGIYRNAVSEQKDLEEELLSAVEELTMVCEKKAQFEKDVKELYDKISTSFDKIFNIADKENKDTAFKLEIIKEQQYKIKSFIEQSISSCGVRAYKKELLEKTRNLRALVICTELDNINSYSNCIEEFQIYLEKEELTIKKLRLRNYIRPILDNLIENSVKNLNEISIELKSKSVIEIACERIQREENSEKLKEQLKNLSEKKIKKLRKKCYQRGLIISFDKEYYQHYEKLKDLVDEHYIFSPEIARSDAKAEKIAGELFNQFVNNESILPLSIKEKLEKSIKTGKSKERVIADYIASMTDKYATEVYNDLNAIASHYEY
jgi:dGTPase